jgi:hypothetical protein
LPQKLISGSPDMIGAVCVSEAKKSSKNSDKNKED